jgi:hypothetical protein
MFCAGQKVAKCMKGREAEAKQADRSEVSRLEKRKSYVTQTPLHPFRPPALQPTEPSDASWAVSVGFLTFPIVDRWSS